MPDVGVVCGLRSEADALGPVAQAHGVFVEVSGARPDKAETHARALVDGGAKILVSWGIAGGLCPGLAPGTLLLPDTVVTLDGHRGALSVGLMTEMLKDARRGVALAGSDTLVADSAAKRALFEATGAIAVDMESHRVSRVAIDAGIPCLVLRAICDPAERTLPHLATTAVDEEGRPRIGSVLRGLLAKPHELPALLKLRRDNAAAHAALARAAPILLDWINSRLHPERDP